MMPPEGKLRALTCHSMFVERLVGYSALLTYLVGWHARAVSFPPSDVILPQLACPLSVVMFLHSRMMLPKQEVNKAEE
jgi:hypothetical protein